MYRYITPAPANNAWASSAQLLEFQIKATPTLSYWPNTVGSCGDETTSELIIQLDTQTSQIYIRKKLSFKLWFEEFIRIVLTSIIMSVTSPRIHDTSGTGHSLQNGFLLFWTCWWMLEPSSSSFWQRKPGLVSCGLMLHLVLAPSISPITSRENKTHEENNLTAPLCLYCVVIFGRCVWICLFPLPFLVKHYVPCIAFIFYHLH